MPAELVIVKDMDYPQEIWEVLKKIKIKQK
jgi:hypothetical protein